MTIKAVLRNGLIQPVDPLPPEWPDGKELLVEDLAQLPPEDLDAWARELNEATRAVPVEEHERFRLALEDQERQSKESVRREWGIP